MNKPSWIIAPPWIERSVGNGKVVIMLHTDQGVITIRVASKAARIPHSTLYNRVVCTPDAWKEEDIFSPKRKRRKREGKYQALPPATKKLSDRPGKPFTAPKLGSWERRAYPADKYRMEMMVKNLPARDAEYRDCLKHHRAMCG